jgi:uncharacterized membrane protein
MLPAILALLSSVTYGAADFLGGLASQRSSTVAVVIVSQLAGLILLAIALPWLPPSNVTVADLAWGGAAGLAGGAGVALLYRGLAMGPMSVVAPVTAVCAVTVPVMVGLFSGEALSMLTATGILLAGTSIVLVGHNAPDPATAQSAREQSARPSALSALPIAVTSGVIIGVFLVALERTPSSAGMWPLVAARAVSISLFGMAALASTQRQHLSRPGAVTAVLGGSADMIANVLYLVAVRQGQLSVIATLTSLYPASTVVLARMVLGERLGLYQKVGVVGAVIAAVMIVRGAVG